MDFPFLRKFTAEFAKDFRVIAYDRRGRGGSTDTRPYSVEKEVEDVAVVCREAGGSPIVVGISSGAALALEAAAAGIPMSRLVAFEGPYMVGSHRKPEHARYEADVTRFVASNDRDGALKLFMRTVGVPAFFLFIMRIMPFWKDLRRVAHTLPYDAAVMKWLRASSRTFCQDPRSHTFGRRRQEPGQPQGGGARRRGRRARGAGDRDSQPVARDQGVGAGARRATIRSDVLSRS
jgi:pimeloyl-ACP methyl ester carboxylesterase